MTVKELIDELQCYEEDKIVWFKVDGQYILVNRVDQEEVENDDDIVIR